MPLNRTTSAEAGPRVLVLMPAEHSSAPSTDTPSSVPAQDSAELAVVRAQLDEALEEVAFLREQLGSAEVWSVHLVETIRTRHRVARELLVRDLAALIEGLDQHARLREAVADGELELAFPVFAAQQSESR